MKRPGYHFIAVPVSLDMQFFGIWYLKLTVACSKTSFISTRRNRCRSKSLNIGENMNTAWVALTGIVAAVAVALGLAIAGFDPLSLGTFRIPGLEPHILSGIEAFRIPGLEPHMLSGIESFRIPGLEPH